MNGLSDWINEQLDLKGWNQAKLARAARVSRAAISNYVNNKIMTPDEDVLQRIAMAVGKPPEEILRVAGLIPSKKDADPTTEQIVHLVSQMDDVDKSYVLDYVEALVRRRQRISAVEELELRLASITGNSTEKQKADFYSFLAKAGWSRLKYPIK